MCVDLISRYKVNQEGGGKKYDINTEKDRVVCLQAVTMVHPSTDWVELRAVPNAYVDYVSLQVELG